jgi:hypothetical protein
MRMLVHVLLALIAGAAVLFYKTVILAPIHYQPQDLMGKIALVAGGSAGIGAETVKKLYEWNATVLMPVRSVDKGLAVRAAIFADAAATAATTTGSISCTWTWPRSTR